MRLTTILLSLLILFSACQKEVSFELPQNNSNAPGPTDSVYFSKLYITESGDTFSTISVTYDALRRVTVLSDSGELGNTPPSYFADIYSFSYSGNDTLPFKMIIRSVQLGFPDVSDTTFKFYDNAGRMIKDSIVSVFPGATVIKYRYAPNRIYGEEYDNANGIIYPASVDTAVLDANSNVISSKKYEWNGTSYYFSANMAYAYDNNFTPLRFVNVRKPLFAFPGNNGHALFYQLSTGLNNITSVTQYDTSTPNFETETILYPLYNTAGYPLKAVYNSIGGPADTLLFRYRALP